MKLKCSLLLLVLLVNCCQIDARHKQKGGKSNNPHHRSKRTIGDIINWKLNLIQSILGGIGGLFGGGGQQQSRPSYGPPRPRPSYNGQRPQRPPSYNNRPQGGGQRPPSYNNRPQGGQRPPSRPQGPPRPNSNPQFGPSNAIKMLPAPNLATGRPPAQNQVSGSSYGDVNLGSAVLDTVTSGVSQPGQTDSYGAPQGPVIQQPRAPASAPAPSPSSYSSPSSSSTSYSSPSSQPQSSYSSPVSNTNSYSSPQPSSSLPAIPTQYGAGATNTFSPGGPIINDNSVPFSAPAGSPAITYNNPVQAPAPPAPSTAPDSYGGAIAPVIIAADPVPAAPRAPESAPDAYGGAIAPVLPPQSAPDSYGGAIAPVLPPVIATTARSFTVDYDDYDPNDVPADQAAPAPELPSYGISSTPEPLDTYGVASNSAFADDYDPNDVPPDQAADPLPGYTNDEAQTDTLDVYGSAVAPVGTSAPVPDDVFTGDGEVQTSYDSYNPVIDLTETEDDDINEIVDLRAVENSLSDGSETASLLPPYNGDEGDVFQEDIQSATPTSAPVLFTYAPSEGSTVDNDLGPQVNIVLQNPEAGGSPNDPLNVIPDEYEEDFEIEDYQVSYDVNNDVGPLEADDDINNNQPSPAFDDLRGIKFTTGPELPALDDPEPTTYRAPIDFDLGTTAATGIEVSNVVTRLEGDYGDESLASGVTEDETYDDAYETEDETDYTPQNQNIPIVVEESVTAGLSRDQEESLPSYDPVVLLVGTPEKSESSLSEVEELPLYENALDARLPSKRKAKNKSSSPSKLRELYNNWYGPRNDWSRKIAKVQGRIRYKKLNQKNSS